MGIAENIPDQKNQDAVNAVSDALPENSMTPINQDTSQTHPVPPTPYNEHTFEPLITDSEENHL